MKKIGIIILLIILSSLGVSIVDKISNKKESNKMVMVSDDKMSSVFISYIELQKLKGKDLEQQKKIIDEMIDNVHNYHLNTIILQVRPFCDAIYNSNIFETSSVVVEQEGDVLNFDILEYFIVKAHQKKIKVHAWINPYRIRSNTNTSSIDKNNIIYSWLNTNKVEIKNGIYLNPADDSVLKLILDGVKEIVLNYDVDGILYDDYFYPSKTIDVVNYESYEGDLSIDDFRRSNITKLIKETYKTIKSINEDVLFSISPAGNLSNNYNNSYLDMEFILKNNEYLDYVMPQLYYGFDNDSKPYIETLKVWNDLILNNDTKLVVALSLYKSGNIDKYAGSGKYEWQENNDIIKRQIEESKKVSNYSGFSIFRYDFLFSDSVINDTLKEERSNLRSILDI